MDSRVSSQPQVPWSWADMFLTYRFWGLLLFYTFSQVSSRLLSVWLPFRLQESPSALVGLLSYTAGITALVGFYLAWAATRRSAKTVLLVAGVLQLAGGLLLTSGPGVGMPLRFVGAVLSGLGAGAITLGVPAILTGGTRHAQAFVIASGLLFAAAYVLDSLLTVALGSLWDRVGSGVFTASVAILVFLGLLSLAPVNPELFAKSPKERTYDWVVRPRNPVLVGVGSFVAPIFYYFLYKFHGEVASLRPSSKTLSPRGALFTLLLFPLAFSVVAGVILGTAVEGMGDYMWLLVIGISLIPMMLLAVVLTSLADTLNELAEERGKRPWFAPWVVSVVSVLFLPVAMGLIQSALNRSVVPEHEAA